MPASSVLPTFHLPSAICHSILRIDTGAMQVQAAPRSREKGFKLFVTSHSSIYTPCAESGYDASADTHRR